MKEFKNFDSVKISWFRCGGVIENLCIVSNVEELKQVLEKYHIYKNNILPIGNGSNILIRDNGFHGLAIKFAGEFNKINIVNKQQVVAGCGCYLKTVSCFALKNNLIGCEFLNTIPGTVGGGIKMNAGCFGCEIKDIFVSAKIMIDGKIKEIDKKEMNFSYRNSNIPKNAIILESTFQLKNANSFELEKSQEKIKEMQKHRKESQVIGATCGSTFKNFFNKKGDIIHSWKLIDDVGLRGYCIGGAKFSEKHCNFIINFNNATAYDIENLINLAKTKVKEKFNIDIQTEIKLI